MGKIKLKVKNIWNYALYCENGVFGKLEAMRVKRKNVFYAKNK